MVERVAHRVGARERRQERRVGVQDASAERSQGPRPDEAHVAGEDDDRRVRCAKGLCEDTISIGALSCVGGRQARQQGRVDPLLRRPIEGRAGPIGEDEADLAAELTAFRGRRQGAQVAARAGDADGDPGAQAATRSGASA